ncbi:patellin-3 [Striga asiatica]|uniref:Patellin-3 n=1 Tax=Striga asiatica TaxID=4170 RepID=A0A5A7PWH9_STRAF|nr:patellin-3 [Striga asiatica]
MDIFLIGDNQTNALSCVLLDELLEKNVRKLDLSPDGIYSIVRINDLKNSRGLILFKELRQGTRLFNLLANRYYEHEVLVYFCLEEGYLINGFVKVFINVPSWFLAYNKEPRASLCLLVRQGLSRLLDCGVFVVAFAEYFVSEEIINVETFDVHIERLRFCYYLFSWKDEVGKQF